MQSVLDVGMSGVCAVDRKRSSLLGYDFLGSFSLSFSLLVAKFREKLCVLYKKKILFLAQKCPLNSNPGSVWPRKNHVAREKSGKSVRENCGTFVRCFPPFSTTPLRFWTPSPTGFVFTSIHSGMTLWRNLIIKLHISLSAFHLLFRAASTSRAHSYHR